MEKLTFDTGVKEFEVNGGEILRFNPADPNVYVRFVDAAEKINAIETRTAERAKKLGSGDSEKRGAAMLRIMRDADKEVKKLLAGVFGDANDFDKIFEGVNLMAVAKNGERVISNFFTAIEPILTDGVQSCVTDEVAAAKAAREERRG